MKNRQKISRTSVFLIVFCMLLLLGNVLLGVLLTRQSANAMKDLIHDRMLDVSNTAAAMIDGDVLENLQPEDKDTPEYQAVLKTLSRYLDNIELEYIYCIRDMGNKEFIFTVDPDKDDPAEYGEPVEYTDALYKASLGEAAVDDEPYKDRWGRYYSAYTPVFDSNNKVAGIVAVDFSAEWYDRQMTSQVRTIVFTCVVSIVLGAIIILAITTRYRRRFHALYDELNDLSDGVEDLSRELSAGAGVKNSEELLPDDIDEDETGERDGLGIMSSKIRKMQGYLSKQISFVKAQAYTDGLTGLGNRTAYNECTESIKEQIDEGTAEFALAMFDINSLKSINDIKGHEIGDQVIVSAAHILKDTFGEEKIFRIGGDEFIVVLDKTADEMEELFERFDKICAESNERNDIEPVDISKGYAVFDKNTDPNYKVVFARADDAMYADKKAYYNISGNDIMS